MKKGIAALLCATMVLGLTACGYKVNVRREKSRRNSGIRKCVIFGVRRGCKKGLR